MEPPHPDRIRADTADQPPAHSHDVWPTCGYRWLASDDANRLRVTADFLRHLFERPELALVDDCCQNELALHEALMDAPFKTVEAATLDAIADPDARENYRFILDFRDFLARYETLESAYLALTTGRTEQPLPPLLINLLVQTLLAHLLRGRDDPYLFRAAELFFRPQRVSLESGVLLADAETLERRRQPDGPTVLQLLIRQAEGGSDNLQAQLELDVLTPATAPSYWNRTEAFDFALSLSPREPGAAALCRVLEVWLRHFHGLNALATPLQRIEDEHWSWHIGLDSDSNAILNALYRGETLDEDALRRLLLLFRLDFDKADRLPSAMAGRPIYLGLAMDDRHLLRMKPQNLLLNLPLAPAA
jgi:hypothetical protein